MARRNDDKKPAAEQDNVVQQNLDYQAPGRAVGLSVMLSLVAFTAVFMAYQSTQLGTENAAQARLASDLSAAESARFSAENFSLPRDSLWGFIPIPAGDFTMGSNPLRDRMAYENERWSSNQRQGRVTLPDYFIGRLEVTNAQFSAYLKATNESMLAQFSARLESESKAGNEALNVQELPVTGITLPQMLSYARWLDQALRSAQDIPDALRTALTEGARVTLPNEAEWEKAARGDDARVFPWGMEPSQAFANFGTSGLHSVGTLACDTCSYGLSDMAGNVWELTRSPLVDYPFDVNLDAQKLLDLEPLWVMRGGSFQDGINNVRSAVRGAVGPSVRNPTIGFRLVISTL